jgi:uncharacterized protein YndB with AHSA1/START domain
MSDSTDVVSVERVIAAPADRIFDLLADPARHQEIDGSGAVRDAKQGGERLAKGSQFGMGMHLVVAYSTMNTVIEFEDGKRLAWQTTPAGKLGARFFGGRIWRYELEPRDGGTLVRETWDISEEKGPVKSILRTAKTKEHTRSSMEKTLATIATLVEQ